MVEPLEQNDIDPSWTLYSFPVLLFGSSGAGKTATISQIADGAFPSALVPTNGENYKNTYIFIDDKAIKLFLYECSESDRHSAILSYRVEKTNAVVIMYDITNWDSFDFAKAWISLAKKHAMEETPIFLIGNKTDLIKARNIKASEGLELAKQYGADFYEISAKTRKGLKEVVWNLVNKLMKREDKMRRLEMERIRKKKIAETQSSSCKCF